MSTIGIIANPASGKDIRRLVSHATVIDNNEKVNILERIILGAQSFGVDKVYIMPDSYMMGYKTQDQLNLSKELTADIEILDMIIKASPKDTERAAQIMEEKKLGCVVVLGGDGTHRLVAKYLKTVPLIGVSTGTNNAYPKMLEGTIVGVAAAVIASKSYDTHLSCRRDKIIEILKNGEFIDICLMDAVISIEQYIGSKAIWNLSNIKKIIVANCHPASIGFSAIVGVNQYIDERDDFGAALDLNCGENRFLAPVAAGKIEALSSGDLEIIEMNQSIKWEVDFKGIIAVDGEREIVFNKGDSFEFKLTRNGPIQVDVRKTMETAVVEGFFKTK
ncbi:MAG: AcoR protein [Clostridiales bacterium 38_11]|nr:MAG: AcoR protein [Clostridiales bacterium 38_11]